MKKITIFVLFIGSLLGCATTSELDRIADARPTPELSPQEVVELQLTAFRSNDEGDQGIGIAFRFASPRNRRATGPVERFARMMRAPGYRPMLLFEEATYSATVVRGRVALQRVALTVDGETIRYDFYLTRQEGGNYDDCWMTESVYIVPPDSGSPQTLNV